MENYITQTAEAILRRYREGVPYVDAVWRGDNELDLNKTFKGIGNHKAPTEEYYFNCFSNEFTLSKGLKVKTKGRLCK